MRKHKADGFILLLTVILMGIGLLVIYTIGPVRANFLNAAYGGNYPENYFFIRQLISIGVSIVAFLVGFKLIQYDKVRKWVWVVMAGAFAVCLLLEIGKYIHLPIVKCSLGACRWLELGPLSLQPAELLKIGVALYFPQLMVQYRDGKLDTKQFWVRYAVLLGLSLAFVAVLQKDLGSAIPIIVEALAILFISGVKMKEFLLVIAAMMVCGVLFIVTSPHRMERLATYLGLAGNSSSVEEVDTADNSDSSLSESADSYHIENALIAIGSGGLFGVGIGNSVQATGYLPESINDSVFAIMGETFGLVGLIVILVLFAVLLTRILKVVDYTRDREVSLAAVGIFAWLATHVVVNIAAMTGIIPLTGITLPLLSYGGTSMACMALMLGLVMQFSENTERRAILDEERVVTRSRRASYEEWRRR